MIKLIRLMGRGENSPISHDEFISHHGTAHLVLFEQCPGFVMGVQDYIQNYIVVEPAQLQSLNIPHLQTDRDSLIEVWWDSVAEFENSLADPKYLELVRPDELSIGDVAGLRDVIADEREIMRNKNEAGRVKLFSFIKRSAGSTAQDFFTYWQTDYAAQLQKVAALARYAHRYVQNPAIALDHAPTPTMTDYDGVDEFWFDSLEDLGRLFADDAWRAAAAQVERRALDVSRSASVVAIEQPESTEWLRRVKKRMSENPSKTS